LDLGSIADDTGQSVAEEHTKRRQIFSIIRSRQEELVSRTREASRFVPLERLAVSPQCGFSNSVIGNALSPADRERKLRLVVETARRVWGEDTA
jgi:hypothetical protein